MPTSLLKEVLDRVLGIITKIINCSISQGIFVPTWKKAIVRRLLKKPGLELLCNNYRPVSNLTFLSKVLEKSVLLQFNRHCENNSLMPDYQSAYRKGYSCETALVKLMDDLLWAKERQEVTALIIMDLSAAFDTVDHDMLLDVLKVNFGIQGKALQWFNTYLRPRSCVVNIREHNSAPRELSFSVPQGSCALPVLYLAYASTLEKEVSQNIGIHGYADDHALRKTFSANSRVEENMAIKDMEDSSINVIKSWMDANRLKMNGSKTEFIMFGHRKQLQKCITSSINIDGDSVNRLHIVKYLGALLDEELTLKQHIQHKCKSAM